MNQGFVRLLAGLLGVCVLMAATAVYAAGTTQRERTMSRYKNCQWTEAMSKEIYDCIMGNNGFSAHWCHDETVQAHCEPDPLETANKEPGPSQK